MIITYRVTEYQITSRRQPAAELTETWEAVRKQTCSVSGGNKCMHRFISNQKQNDKTPGETDGAADAPVRDVTSHQPSDAADMTELRWSSEGLQPAGRPEASLTSCDCISVV